MSFSPVEASKHITEKYYRYLKTIFKMGEPYKNEFEYLIDNSSSFAKGPYLDVTYAFKKGKNLRQLIDEGLLPDSFSRINMNMERTLYLHQEKSIRKIAEGKNVVVSTGTGSGKTESFLIPILRYLTFEYENNTLGPGVRALLIYPMNALANDQTERLRDILKDFPEITFGVYTGQTRQRKEEALIEYKSLNNGSTPIPNEFISREEMIESPPNIFITNYAMLEYLMVRPQENVFFEGYYADAWKFIVFDEAHVYHGSTGIEVSMLFRRLKAKLNNKELTYILTSATLGDDKENDKVAEFAYNLCNADFFPEDVIRADRIIPEPEHETDTLPISFYELLSEACEKNLSENDKIKLAGGCAGDDLSEILFDKILHDKNYWKIRKLLSVPATVSEVASGMNWSEEQLTSFVRVASLAEKNMAKIFDARYHMFIRATESIFITLAPDNHVLLQRANYRYNAELDKKYKIFEAAVCSHCGSVYIIGKTIDRHLEQYNLSDDPASKEVYLLKNNFSDTDEDHTLENEGIKAEEYYICPECGYIHKAGDKNCCEHDSASYIKVWRATFTGTNRNLTKCLSCENVNSAGILRMFFTGQEAVTSVLGTALFQELPSYEVKVKKVYEEEDEFGIGTEREEESVEKKSKQFIAFSDSRQAAAFYASYLDISYHNILRKRMIVEVAEDLSEDKDYPAKDFVDKIRYLYEKNNFSSSDGLSSEFNAKKEAWKAVLSELVDNASRISLNQMGLLGISIDTDGAHWAKFGFDEKEFKSFCSILIYSMLSDAAILYDASLNENDKESFTHNGVECEYTLSEAKGSTCKAFIPTKAGLSNKRLDYLQKILHKKYLKGIIDRELTNDELTDLLKKIWEVVFENKKIIKRTEENKYKVNFNRILLGRHKKWYYCSKCKKITCHNVEDVCPSYQCDGSLIPFDCAKEYKDNHYYRLYKEMEIEDLKIVEHTAQLDRSTAYEYQKKFKQNDINILSCSTTFEMGVDVGSLETVFMRNMPPMPANYAQRAGRAGRSSNAAAYALTFCNKSSHDFSYFADPVNMIKGKISPPIFIVNNDRIAIRHLYASAMAYFWRIYPGYFSTVDKFAEKDEDGDSGFEKFKVYLYSNPVELKKFILNFLPDELIKIFDVNNFGWVDGLIGDEGVLTNVINNYLEEVKLLEEEKERLFKDNKNIDYITQRLKAYKKDNILSFLSRKNVMPKYGFPVDTVEMTVASKKGKSSIGLELQRDLSMAISEYAPGSQIVANNNLITSRYIRKKPNIGWKMYSYIKCPNCKTLNIKPYTENTEIKVCCQCKEVFKSTPQIFLIPADGFIADSNIDKPKLKKPERTYRGETSYVGFNNDVNVNIYSIGTENIIVKTSHNDEMAVLNTSPFYVCERCGYAEVDEKRFTSMKMKKHKNASGYKCGQDKLKKYALGYRFLTDVVRLQFTEHKIENFDEGISILYGLLRGICTHLNIEENDISGCLQSNYENGKNNIEIVIFDNTPGGAGHARRLDNASVLEGVLKQTLRIVEGCTCGGEAADTSCYSCLRSYKNQKYHDIIKRRYVIDFLHQII